MPLKRPVQFARMEAPTRRALSLEPCGDPVADALELRADDVDAGHLPSAIASSRRTDADSLGLGPGA